MNSSWQAPTNEPQPVPGLTEASCRCLQRLAVQCWAFHAPPKRLRDAAIQQETKEMLKGDDLGWDLMQAPVHFGGACGRNLALLHSSPECLEGEELAKGWDELEVFGSLWKSLEVFGKPGARGVFLSTDEAKVVSRVRDLLRWKHLQPQEICWFFGHCRWQPGELEAAIQGGYFASAYCDPAFLVPPSTNLWHDLSALLL
eukprot:Skav220183  [mRNA]  locus=scaffold1271:338081:344125:+ [translate_table: standard]